MINWKFKVLTKKDTQLIKIQKEINEIIGKNNDREKNDLNENVSEILPNLWLGNKRNAHDQFFVTGNGIKYIINVTDNVENKFEYVTYINFKIRDIMACQGDIISTLDIMKHGAKIIDYTLRHNIPILIHCKQGHHRSASIIAFYLMTYHDYTLTDAIRRIKSIRPRAFRRMSCMMETLTDFEVNRICG